MKKIALLIFFVFLNFILLNSRVIAGVTYLGSGEAFDTTSDNSTPAGIAFNNDGTKVFVMGTDRNEDEVNEYSLGTAWDISTTNAITRRLGVGTGELGTPIQDSAPFGITFNGDGTKLYISGNGNNKIFELDLGSAFNISSAVKAGELQTDLHANGDATPCGITFNNDGTKLFLAGFANHRIVYWTLKTPYNIESAGDPGKYDVSSTSNKPRDVDFNSDGTKMYVVSGTGDHIAEYTLDTAFDLSSGVTHKGDLDVGSQESEPFTMEFNSDGTKLFMQGYTNDDIHEYTLTTAFELNNTAPTLSSSSPSDGASSVGVNDNIVLTFSEVVDAESGNIIIKKSSDDSTVETISVTSSNVSGSGSTQITINPDTTLDDETGYYITIASTAFDDVDSADYAGISSSSALNFTTSSNPFEDKAVVALVEAQTEAPKRILQHVTTPVLNRMDWLRRHRKEDNLTNQNIKFQFSNEMLSSLSKVISASFDVNEASKLSDNWSFWSEGSISVGKIGDTSSSFSKDINSNGITIGMDKKIDENKMYGYALRFGRDDVDVGTSGTSLDTEAYSLSLYGTFPHDETKFIDSVLGVSSLKTDHVRKSGANTLTGERSGRQAFGSINFRTTYNKDEFNVTPNGRLDLGYTELSSYSETGTDALIYDKQKIKTGMVSFGMMLDDTVQFENITLKPNGRLEYGTDFSPSSDATVSYVSDPSTDYTLSIAHEATHNIRAGLGFDFITESGLTVMTNYERDQSDNAHTDTLYFGVSYISNKETEYALSIDGNESLNTSFNITKNISGFDLKLNLVYDLSSGIPNQFAGLSLSSTF